MRKLVLTVIAALALSSIGLPVAMAQRDNPNRPDHCEETPGLDLPDGRKNERCPENPPCDADHGVPALKSPACEEEDGNGAAACTHAPLGNLHIAVEGLVDVCVVAFILEGEGDAVCPAGTLRIPAEGELEIPDVVALCVTVLPEAAA